MLILYWSETGAQRYIGPSLVMHCGKPAPALTATVRRALLNTSRTVLNILSTARGRRRFALHPVPFREKRKSGKNQKYIFSEIKNQERALLPHIDVPHLPVIWVGMVLSYVVFGIAGFGTALVASPLLAQVMPVSHIVPLLALLDFFAATTNLMRDGRKAEMSELKRLVPLMIIGSGAGALILLFTKPDILLLLLGIFVVCYSVYSLSGYRPAHKFRPVFAVPFGLVGGVFSALFGSGGFIYAVYLQSRLESKEHIRVTQTTLIGLSTLTRLVIFLAAGVYADVKLLLLAAVLAPSMLAGVWIGRRITLELSREQFVRLVNIVILVSGIGLIARYFS
jgi:uncharacterized membrane protein YfcA